MPGVNRLLTVVRPTAPVLLLCGYYGEHNLGDDALLQVLVSSLPHPVSYTHLTLPTTPYV